METDNRTARQETAGKPLPLVEYTIWLLQPRNWRRHWKAIVIALVVFAFADSVYLWIAYAPKSPAPSSETQPPGSIPKPLDLLNDDEVRLRISQALHHADLDEAIGQLAGLSQRSFKTDECERVFDYAIKNHELAKAKSVVDLCWMAGDRTEKLSVIEHERPTR